MKGATQCARRLKQLIRSLRTKLGKPGRPPTGDAVTQMILGIFSRDLPESKARDVLDRLRGMVVDYNELRVIPTIELIDMVGDVPDARRKCEDLSRSLNSIFAVEHDVSLERLRELPRKDVIAYLDKIDGLDPYVRARIRLYGLQQHAIPLDEAMWAYARKTEIVHPRCPLDEAQAFLERRIAEDEAVEVVGLIEKQAWAEMGGLVRRGEVQKITSVPPDRTTRHMLRMVASGGSVSAATTTAAEPTEKPASPEKKATATGKTAKTRKAASSKKTTNAEAKKTAGGSGATKKATRSAAGKKKSAARKTTKTAAGKTAKKTPAKPSASKKAGSRRTAAAAKRKPGGGSKAKSAARSGSGKAARGKASAASASGRSTRRSAKARSA